MIRTIQRLTIAGGFSLTLVACPARQQDSHPIARAGALDLSTPESPVLAYCQATSVEVARRCFDEEQPTDWVTTDRVWSSCRIVEVREAELDERWDDIQKGDFEVVTEVRMIDEKKGNPLTRYWYLVRNRGGGWKIVSWTHMSDENYPPID